MKQYRNQFGENPHLKKRVGMYPNHITTGKAEQIEIGFFLAYNMHEHNIEACKIARLRDLSRQRKTETNPDVISDIQRQKRVLKTTLPAITPTAYYPDKHKLTDTHRGSGLFCVDIDRKDNEAITEPEWLNLPQNLMKSGVGKYIAYIGESASGFECGGYFLLVSCPTDTTRHTQRVAAFIRVLQKAGINCDKMASMLNHYRALSTNERADLPVSNPAAIDWVMEYEPPKITIRETPTANFNDVLLDEYRRVKRCVEYLQSKQISLADSHENWLRFAYSLANTFGKDGKPLFFALAALSEKFETAANEYLWGKVMAQKKKKNQINTFWFLVKQAGLNPANF